MTGECVDYQVLIIEQQASLASLYRDHLEKAGFRCRLATSPHSCANPAAEPLPHVVLLNLETVASGFDTAISQLVDTHRDARIIVVAANASIAQAVAAVRAGAWDYLVSPVSRTRLVTTLKNACTAARPARRSAPDPSAVDAPAPTGQTLLGTSAAMQDLRAKIGAVATSSAPVFITGESGTGKELCARAVHDLSPRRARPFVALNCGAIPHDLMESEIFGHLKGAFTGAISDRRGAAAAADGGTLFLDELCEMDLALQVKLLRFLQTGVIQPVGSADCQTVDVRIVCATNRRPRAEIARGRLREDLFFRLHVLPVEMPPLRERTGDIALLATAFLRQYASQEKKAFSSLAADTVKRLEACPWPGNVRQLQNVIRQAVVMNSGEVLQAAMLPADLNAGGCRPDKPAVEPHLLWQIERDAIERAISRCAGSIPKAAGMLGVSPSTIYRKRESWAARTA